MKNKLLKLLFTFVILLSFVGVPALAGGGKPSTNNPACNDPNSAVYGSQECIRQKLGLDTVNTDGFFARTNPLDYIILAFQILLAIVILIVVYRIVVAGITIANAKEDADKRKEGFVKMLNAVIGLVVALSSYGIVMAINNAFGVKIDSGVLSQCADLAIQYGDNSQQYKDCVAKL